MTYQPQTTPEPLASKIGFMQPTKYLDRFRASLALLCGGVVPSVEHCEKWLRGEQESSADPLQSWACTHALFSWTQGIAIIDAATLLADSPEEGVEHEEREDAYPALGPTLDDLAAVAVVGLPMRDMAKPGCRCEACVPMGNPFAGTAADVRMILCAICGNKRCPHATDHRLKCTSSNVPGQRGSSYADMKPFAPITEFAQSIPLSTPPRFPNVYCSQCGKDFGAGNNGFSHCDNHAHLRALP